MNRRKLLKGIGATGIIALVPVLPAEPIADTILIPAHPNSFIAALSNGNILSAKFAEQVWQTFIKHFENNSKSNQVASLESNG